jgi:hypothetical protein
LVEIQSMRKYSTVIPAKAGIQSLRNIEHFVRASNGFPRSRE